MNPEEAPAAAYAALELLPSAIILADAHDRIHYVNASAEHLFERSRQHLPGQPLAILFSPLLIPSALTSAIERVRRHEWSYTRQNLDLVRPHAPPLHLECTLTPVQSGAATLLLEFRPIDAQLRVAYEERLIEQQRANRELIGNLAHEIKNPLGGIRGAAQLLATELAAHPELREYTDVIIQETDRLQALMRRLLGSQRGLRPEAINIHTILEQVRRLILAEFPALLIERDYDLSLPSLMADAEQLHQAILNIVRNAAQALAESPPARDAACIRLRTRIARQVTLAKRRHRLALELQIIDNGPGIPPELRDRIFYPLVSGRPTGSGLGLSLAQNIIAQHQGMIDVDSRPGYTAFLLRLPLPAPPHEHTPT